MTAKQYLSQAYRIDQRISSKIEQVAKLREMAAKATSSISDMPRSDSPQLQSMESTIIKIMELKQDINRDIDELVDLKREMYHLIAQVSDIDQQLLLELRYLCFKTWSAIAETLGVDERHTFRMHNASLATFQKIFSRSVVNVIECQYDPVR